MNFIQRLATIGKNLRFPAGSFTTKNVIPKLIVSELYEVYK